jgi:K(+)-stimulated pyrophosphate-energized sodium pump
MLIFMVVSIAGSISLALVTFSRVRKMDSGNELMREVASAIQEGAAAFLSYEYRTIAVSVLIIAAVLGVLFSWATGIAFLIGALVSALSGIISMKIATVVNVRTAQVAHTSHDIEKTMKCAFKGGSVVGLSMGGFSILGLLIIYVVFGKLFGQYDASELVIQDNWLSIPFIPFATTVAGYALGCSVIAMFNRIGGGIYTKAADIGADLVGKVEMRIPEDDPRNPATVADNVGDNVGAVAGLGTDIMESFVAALISTIVVGSYMFFAAANGDTVLPIELVHKLFLYPLAFAAAGLIASMIGIFYVSLKKTGKSLYRELIISINIAGVVAIVAAGILAAVVFSGAETQVLGFRAGGASPWLCASIGIIGGMIIGRFSEVYTSYDFQATQRTAESSREGTALTLIQGMSSGMQSVFPPVIVLAGVVVLTLELAGIYGVALAAVGMISFVASTIAVDTFGPIIDNAGGLCEMADLSGEARDITDRLDSIGNTTDAIAKGFAVGSAMLGTVSLFVAFLYTQVGWAEVHFGENIILNLIDSLTLAGALVGSALPFFFSGRLLEAVANAARRMVTEVRRQFKIDPAILSGERKPDYRQCIEISSIGAIRRMKGPAMLSLLFPLGAGLILGPKFVGGVIVGAGLTGVVLAFFTANTGGIWENGKRFIEKGRYGGKGSPAHQASIIADTMGDPLKDTIGPSLDILIKILAVVALLTVSITRHYNLLALIGIE